MKYFKDYREMLAECDALLTEDRWDAEDRATIQEFYNGRETMTASEAEKRGVDNVTNHLFGFDSMAAATGQIMGIYSKPRIMLELEFPHAPIEHRRHWEQCATAKFNSLIKESRRFKPQWKALAGELPLHGRGVLMHTDNEDWCPKFARPFVPRGTGILPDDVPYCMVPDYLTMVDIENAIKQSEGRKEKGYDVYWNLANLKTVLNLLKSNLGGQPGVNSFTTDHSMGADERAELRQASADGSVGLRTRIPVFYFYHKNDEGEFGLTVLPRITPQQDKYLRDKALPMPDHLFDRPGFFEKPCYFIHPFFIDCELGGMTTWHRVLGLGRLNYDPDVEMEEFFNDAVQGSRENLRRLYQVQTAADWEILKTWATGGGPSNVLPPGVGLAEANKQPNFQHAFTTMEMLQQLTRRNAAPYANAIGGGSEKELEVNAMERQGRNAEAMSTRIADVYECIDAVGTEMFRRFLAESPLPTDPGYCEISEFQREMRERGIPLAHLRKTRDYKYVNFRVKCSRAMGDGSEVKRQMVNNMLWSRLPLFSAESQEVIKRRLVSEETGDYDFAEQVVPYEAKENPDQVARANQENDTCDRQGIIGVVPQLGKDDLHDVHLNHHLRGMQADIARGKVRQWDEVDLAGFKSKGGHSAMHIQAIAAVPEMKAKAMQFEQQLESLAKQGQEFANNLQKAQEAKEMTPKEQADLQLKQQKQQLAERAQGSLEQHRAEALGVTKSKAEVSNMVQMRSTALNEQSTMHGQRMDEADRVMEARQAGAESGTEEADLAANQPPELEPELEGDNPVP